MQPGKLQENFSLRKPRFKRGFFVAGFETLFIGQVNSEQALYRECFPDYFAGR
jgi:hypothetical protein